MIRGPVNEIDVEALRALVADRVGEGKTLEYKREMPGGPDGGRVRFLKAVSAFANTAGSDLLLGVEAVDGVATALPGVDLDNPDGETLRLENMIRDGLEPRLPRVEVCPVKIAEHRYVLVVRVPRSWIAPHRVRKNRQLGSIKIRGVKRRNRPPSESRTGVRGRRLDVRPSMSATLTPRILILPASAAHRPESCASLAATICSMSVSVVDAKHRPVYGPYTAPSSRTMSRSTDCGYG